MIRLPSPPTAAQLAIDPLEFARGALCSMSFVSPESAREIHVARLHDQFDRAGIAPSMKDALGSLQFLREVEPLDGGYWIPASTRTVDVDGTHSLLVGVHPTSELRRHFSSTRRAGDARVVETSEVARLPKQSLVAWRGSDGLAASAWAQMAIESAMAQFAPSIAENVETFGTRNGKRLGGRSDPVWVPLGDNTACTWRGVGLFRARTGASRYRYFLGRHDARSSFLEGPATREPLRMQFGLGALQGKPLTIRLTSNKDAVSIALPLSPPNALRRLLTALCEADLKSFGHIWTCRNPEWLRALYAPLEELGCETVHHE